MAARKLRPPMEFGLGFLLGALTSSEGDRHLTYRLCHLG